MGYQVLARKWRPQNFSQLVGQEHVVAAISNALKNQRLHHAYLFTGTRGVGKTTIARIFSKSLNCEQGMGAEPCGQCQTCVDIDQGRFIDLLEIDAASRTKVEDTRDILDNVQYKPTRGRYKVYLIDEVHMLSKHSFNALLKTLEEPPEHVKFLLATTDPQKLPVTILSRCLQFNLKAMSREQISGQLSFILEEEGLSFEPSAVAQLARAANGSMRDALSLTDQAVAQGDGQVTLGLVSTMLGLMDKNQVLKLVNAIANGNASEVFSQLDDLVAQSVEYDQLLAEVQSLFHQIALTQVVPDACKLETISAKAIYQLAKQIPAEQVQLFYQIALQGRKDMPHAVDGRTGLEMTLMRMLAFKPQINDVPASHIPERQVVEVNQDQLAALSAQQTEIIQQAEQLDTSPTGEQPDELHSANDMVDSSDLDSQPTLVEPSSSQPQELEQSESAIAPATASTQPAGTDALLALRRALRQQKEEGSSEKKSEPTGPTVALALPRREKTQSESNVETADESHFTPSEVVDSKQPVVSEVSEIPTRPEPLHDEKPSTNEQEPPPWLDEIPASDEVVESLSDDSHIAINSTQIESEQTDELAELMVPVTIEVPAVLDDKKVTRAAQIDKWSAAIDAMQVQGLTKQLALHSAMSKEGNSFELLLLESQAHLNNPNTHSQLQAALSKLTKSAADLKVTLGSPQNTPFAINQMIKQRRREFAVNSIESDPAVNEIMQQFNAQVSTASIRAINPK